MLFEYLTKDKIAIKYLLVYPSSLFSENDCSYWTRINTRIFCMIYFIFSLIIVTVIQYTLDINLHSGQFVMIAYFCPYMQVTIWTARRYMFLWIVHVKMLHWYTSWLSMPCGINIFVAKECTWMCMKNNVFFLIK